MENEISTCIWLFVCCTERPLFHMTNQIPSQTSSAVSSSFGRTWRMKYPSSDQLQRYNALNTRQHAVTTQPCKATSSNTARLCFCIIFLSLQLLSTDSIKLGHFQARKANRISHILPRCLQPTIHNPKNPFGFFLYLCLFPTFHATGTRENERKKTQEKKLTVFSSLRPYNLYYSMACVRYYRYT